MLKTNNRLEQLRWKPVQATVMSQNGCTILDAFKLKKELHALPLRASDTTLRLIGTDLLNAHLNYFLFADHMFCKRSRRITSSVSERQFTQSFRARSAGDDPCATFHDNLDPCSIVLFNRRHVFKVNEV